jgi:hypothetical protein
LAAYLVGDDDLTELRLRYGAEAVRALVAGYDADTALTWLMSEKRALDRARPAWVIRHADSEAELQAVVALAREFAVS